MAGVMVTHSVRPLVGGKEPKTVERSVAWSEVYWAASMAWKWVDAKGASNESLRAGQTGATLAA